MPHRTPEPIPERLRRNLASLIGPDMDAGDLTRNEVMDLYRKRAGVSHNDLATLTRQLADRFDDPSLFIAHSTWQHTLTGYGGDTRLASTKLVAIFLYLLGLDLLDLRLDRGPIAERAAITAVLEALKSGRAAARSAA